MDRSLIKREILPLAAVFGGLVIATLLLDGVLHGLGLVWIGRWLGIPGVLLILVSLLYSLRKRKIITHGNPIRLLRLHKWMAWLGSLLVLVHAGIHFNALLAWLAVGAMLLNVASGLTGAFLLGRAQRHVETRRQRLLAAGLSAEEAQERLFWDAVTLDILRNWRVVHYPIALTFALLATGHVVSTLLFWGWR